ncbi:MAG TPA: tail fiber domain-containing protein [Polyangiales bacterium]|nr:tail fiber domain-containing protein [Polyangiales bacterium]
MSPALSSETHFLRQCEGTCPGELSCICGVCSRACESSSVCDQLAAGAECLPVATPAACSPNAPAKVCDVSCRLDSDCAALSREHVCDRGHCRQARGSEPTRSDAGANADAAANPDAGRDARVADAEAVVPDAGAVPCGNRTCLEGLVCCDHCTGACVDQLAGRMCPDELDPDRSCDDAGPITCGNVTCGLEEVCCDHCTSRCRPRSYVGPDVCPDQEDPTRTCADAGATCATRRESCLSRGCCDGLVCCAGVPIPEGMAYCDSICPMSDRNLKADIRPAAVDAVLDGVLALPISTWRYKTERGGVQHIGPMAQDFKATFSVGSDDTRIFQIDADGVSLAAIQALGTRVQLLDAAQTRLQSENRALREELAALREQLAPAARVCDENSGPQR